MKITKSADFAMRVILCLASDDKVETMPYLSEKIDIPYNNLSKLVQALSKAGIIKTKQGKNGGIQLLMKPADISLKTILDTIDGPTRLSDCLIDHRFCTQTQGCKLKGKLLDIQNQIDTILQNATIEDINKG